MISDYIKKIICIILKVSLFALILNLMMSAIVIKNIDYMFYKVEPFFMVQSYKNDMKYDGEIINISKNIILQCFLKKTEDCDATVYPDLRADLYFFVDDSFNLNYVDGNIDEIWNENIHMYISKSSKIGSIKINFIDYALMVSDFKVLKVINQKEHKNLEEVYNYINYIDDKSIFVNNNYYNFYRLKDRFWHWLSYLQFNKILILVKSKILFIKYKKIIFVSSVIVFTFLFSLKYVNTMRTAR